jgi:hypothetical protein
MTLEHDPQELLAKSTLLVSKAEVRDAVDRMAARSTNTTATRR